MRLPSLDLQDIWPFVVWGISEHCSTGYGGEFSSHDKQIGGLRKKPLGPRRSIFRINKGA